MVKQSKRHKPPAFVTDDDDWFDHKSPKYNRQHAKRDIKTLVADACDQSMKVRVG